MQKHPAESHELASNFVLDARQTLTGPNRHHDLNLNMDQTPLVCNAWMNKGYDWFADGNEVEDKNGGVHIRGNDVFYDNYDDDLDVDLN